MMIEQFEVACGRCTKPFLVRKSPIALIAKLWIRKITVYKQSEKLPYILYIYLGFFGLIYLINNRS